MEGNATWRGCVRRRAGGSRCRRPRAQRAAGRTESAAQWASAARTAPRGPPWAPRSTESTLSSQTVSLLSARPPANMHKHRSQCSRWLMVVHLPVTTHAEGSACHHARINGLLYTAPCQRDGANRGSIASGCFPGPKLRDMAAFSEGVWMAMGEKAWVVGKGGLPSQL